MGQKVKHEKFGFGTVINVEGSDNNTRLQIAFQAQGIKWLIAHLAKLEKVRQNRDDFIAAGMNIDVYAQGAKCESIRRNDRTFIMWEVDV